MLYDIHADMGRMEDVDLDGDGIPETRRPEIKILTVEAATGDEAAAKAMTMGAKFVRGVSPAKVQPAAIAEAAAMLDRAPVNADMVAIDTADPAVMAEMAKIVADAPRPVPANAAKDLLARADGLHVKTLQAAAAKILGDETPATKAEIIAALHAKAA